MSARHVWIGVAAGLLAVSGCGSGSSKEADKPAPAATTGGTAEQPYLDALKAIDPGLVVNKDRAVNRSKNVCADIQAGKDDATVIKNAAARFNGGDATVDEAKAKQIVEVIKSTKFCG